MNASRVSVLAGVLVGLLGITALALEIETVPVGDAGNTPNTLGGQGAVSYTYQVGKYEVTWSQWCTFLNAVARTDPAGLYDPNWVNVIARAGTPGSYTYSMASSYHLNRPVESVSFWDACRFANWLHNGQPDAGVEDSTTTEDGAYTLNGYNGPDGHTVTRNRGALWAIPSRDEWHKAAYYKGGGLAAGYWRYPTRSNTVPVAEAPPGRSSPPGSANYANVVWNSTVVGAYTQSPGPYGTFDQGGNVQEWTEAVEYFSYRWLRAHLGGDYRGFYGYLGSGDSCWSDPSQGNAASWSLGFRVVQVPEPCSAVLLLIGSLMLIRHRRY